MHIYKATLELMDYVFYATVERGKVYETGAFIHNYALAYALGMVHEPTYTYAHQKQVPQYQNELTPLNGKVYLTPGTPDHVAYRLIQWNTMQDGYAIPGKEPSIGYPDWGFARVLQPGCEFTFYVLVNENHTLPNTAALHGLLKGAAVHIRLGKFLGKARLRLQKADSMEEKHGDFVVETLLNWRDLENDPLVCDVLPTSLPTRLIHHAHFTDGALYEARFGEHTVRVPMNMRFLARPPKLTRSGRKSK